MARSKEEISSILSDLNLKRDTYNLIKYSDEVVEVAKTKYGNILNRTSIIEIIREFKENNKFKTLVNRFETIFKRLVNFIKNKINKTKDNDKYIELSKRNYSYGIFNVKTVKNIKKKKNSNDETIIKIL